MHSISMENKKRILNFFLLYAFEYPNKEYFILSEAILYSWRTAKMLNKVYDTINL